MPHQRPPEPGPGDAPRGVRGPVRPPVQSSAPRHGTTGRSTAAPEAPSVPRQRAGQPPRPPRGGAPLPPAAAGPGRTTTQTPPGGRPPVRPGPGAVVPGPGAPDPTPPGGRPRTRVLPSDADRTRAVGPGGPVGPVGGGPTGPGGRGGSGGSGDGGADDTAAGGTLKADLSPTKIAAGAGAAVVTAVLGSFLGAVGTVIGAALGSVISTLATTLFTRSIEVSKDKALAIKDRAAVRRGRGVAEGTAEAAQGPAPDGRGLAGPTGEETVLLDPWQQPGGTTRAASGPSWAGRFRRVRVTRKTVLVSAVLGVVTFAVSMFLISGIEFVKGSSLSGSSGTSVSNVVRGGDTGARDRDSGEGTSSSSSTSESSTSTEESGTSTSESSTATNGEDSSSQDGSSSSNPLQDGLNRVLPTQQPGSGQGSGSGQGGTGQDSGTQN
ncbi:hypothetical protein [Pseudonocardia spirodelae]|uniref:Translation initiation factor IF-2 n=1 Tax=Pseudonocardia spirodelae TaxID=3133431 RepID=A0ABU8TAT1_9PSEU